MDNAAAADRLRAAVESVNGVIVLLNETCGGVEAMRQIRLVQADLHQVAVALFERHLTLCVTAVVRTDGDGSEMLDEIKELFCWANRALA